MSDLRKAAEMALEALESVYGKGKRCEAAINALRQALAQPEQECTCSAKDMPFGRCCKAQSDEALAEREACAKVCEEIAQAKTYQTGYLQETAEECVEAIRARGEK